MYNFLGPPCTVTNHAKSSTGLTLSPSTDRFYRVGGTALFTLALQWQNHKAMPTEVKMQVQLNHPYLYICPSLEAMAGLDVVAELLVPSEYPLLYRLPDWVASCSWLAAMPIICCPAYCWPPGQTCEK